MASNFYFVIIRIPNRNASEKMKKFQGSNIHHNLRYDANTYLP